ncbi:pyridoxal phosphate-dependent transferase [Scleroderma yunnanense]
MSASIAIGSDTLGWPLPSALHAITVSIPNWHENVEYLEGQPATVDAMTTGYPRFFIHHSIQKAHICLKMFGHEGELCLLCPTQRTAEHGKTFIHNLALQASKPPEVRVICYDIVRSASSKVSEGPMESGPFMSSPTKVYIIFFHAETYKIARQFWQNCGLGISSRYAELCLSILGIPGFPQTQLSEFLCAYGKSPSRKFKEVLVPKPQDESELPFVTGSDAKSALRRRMAGFFVCDESVPSVTEDDVFLFPCGMSALWNAHQLLMGCRPPERSVVFGFPYTDTIKILQKSGPGAIFYGYGEDSDIDDLDTMLAKKVTETPSQPPILALFTECPSNPRLHTVNMPRLRALADKYDFLIVIDETIGTFANVDVLPYADIVVTSLSKFVCGYATALGGSLVVNPRMRYHTLLKEHLTSMYEDTYFDPDAIVMERNSRDFSERMRITNTNAEYICDFLHTRSIEGGASEKDGLGAPVIKRVYYPKYVSRKNYEVCRRRLPTGELDTENGGYGGLFSLTFTSMKASETFYNTLEVAKGPTLGTTFTLCCPYTLLGHYWELDWAASYGVDEGLVRVSIGTEDRAELFRAVEVALRAAESACMERT